MTVDCQFTHVVQNLTLLHVHWHTLVFSMDAYCAYYSQVKVPAFYFNGIIDRLFMTMNPCESKGQAHFTYFNFLLSSPSIALRFVITL